MSIPPLVCSTPPPPDQCEDDKEPEDFDISYNLSQEDDDDENNTYNYGSFSTYNNFQSAPDDKPMENKEQVASNYKNEMPKEMFPKYELDQENVPTNESPNVFGTSDINENKLKCEEDMNIEDLNLKVDEEIENIIENNTNPTETSDPNVASVKDFDIPFNTNNDSPSCDNTNASSFDENTIDSNNGVMELNTDTTEPIEQPVEVLTKEELYSENIDDTSLKEKVECSQNDEDNEFGDPIKFENNLINSETPQDTSLEQSPINLDDKQGEYTTIDDEFGDFDDFQSVNIKSDVTSLVENSGNPWDNADSNDSDFGKFTANFDENKFQTEDFSCGKSETVSNVNHVSSETKQIDSNVTEDDDFGDFDDFKSSAAKIESNEYTETVPPQELPVLNLQSAENEHQIMESITKVLSSVFLEEISEPESDFEGKLESLLSETWGHLMETDERQPYIVNWNNSLGQKTLLKALCIDSRNILFGPKWSSNMPKYAANLSNAPLQPQKQASVPSSIVLQNEIAAEKSSSKPTTWTDPFTSDGQEFTYAEALLLDLEHLMATLDQMAHNHSTLKISELLSHACNTEKEIAPVTPGPTDLDVFEAPISTKPDKIYSNTMSIQPLRQINLPDTHIFTPTDSEIPRSKTIHYDRGPTVLLPQPNTADNNSHTDKVTTPTTNNIVENNVDDNEYWEFQNFKNPSDPVSLPGSTSGSVNSTQQETAIQEKTLETATTVNALPIPNIAYQTELLQPIKVEPAMPTLNWPDPGEVKGVFDDFSEFVSISSQSTEKQDDSLKQSAELQTNDKISKSDHLKDSLEVTTDITKSDKDGFDDDFDTFKSALPSKTISDSFKSTFENTSSQMLSSNITEFNYGSPKIDSIKSDTISFASVPRPNEALTQNIGYIKNTTELTNKISLASGTQMPTSLLQPTVASFSNTQNQQKMGQILQPLSLESYSQINWPSPGIDLQDLSRFNPVETLQSLKSDLSVSGPNKVASPSHSTKNAIGNQVSDDDVWGDFVSSKPKQQQSQLKKPSAFVDDDEWTDFISSPSVKPQNGLNTISLNVHTNSSMQKSGQSKFVKKNNQPPLDIPALNYITPKSNPHKSYNDKHFQNL